MRKILVVLAAIALASCGGAGAEKVSGDDVPEDVGGEVPGDDTAEPDEAELPDDAITPDGGKEVADEDMREWELPWDVQVDCEDVCTGLKCGLVGECDCGPDCGPEMTCDESSHECVPVEDPDCEKICADAAKECGEYGECWCGECAEGSSCVDGVGVCVPNTDPCVAGCDGKECGVTDIGCDCGECDDGAGCEDFKCVPMDMCNVSCIGIECGPTPDGCDCGQCTFGECVGGTCVCEPQCTGKECGPDGCGGDCGACPNGGVCAWNSKCYAKCDPNLIGFSEVVQKIVALSTGEGGHPGQALDVDGDAGTCAPAGDCEAGLDNQMSSLFDQMGGFGIDIDATMLESCESGALVMLMEMISLSMNGSPFTLNMFMGAPQAPKNTCDFQTTKCNYLVSPDSIDGESCKPVFWFDNATIVNNYLNAGGKGYQFTMMLSLIPSVPLKVWLYNAKIAGVVGGNLPGIDISEGIIAGAIPKDKLLQGIDEIPDEVPLPIGKDMLKMLLDMSIQNDIDTDGDGENDSASTAMAFDSIAGSITGVLP